MKIEAIQEFICIESFPGFSVGTRVSSSDLTFDPFLYPHLFSQLYVFENGDVIFEGAMVFRLQEKSFTEIPKAVKFDPNIHGVSVEVWPTMELANKAIDESVQTVEKKYADGRVKTLLENIYRIAEFTEDMSLKTLKSRAEMLKVEVENLKSLLSVL
jgi:hypothetical protein